MARESIQKKISRVRRPRVHIIYEVETEGKIEKKEIPFVVGVLADLSAEPAEELPRIEERNFEEVDRDNINDVMARSKPRLVIQVPNKLVKDNDKDKNDKDKKDPGELRFELEFNKLADFHPESVAQNVPPLKELLELRKKLSSLQTRVSGNAKLESLLREAIEVTERTRSR